MLSVCGTRVRLWTFDALCFRTSPLYDLDNDEDLVGIARLFALLASSSAHSTWSLDEVSFDLEETNGATLDWKLLPGCSRASMFGRRTVCWSTPIKDEERSLILKASWMPRHLQDHEPNVLDIVCKAAFEHNIQSLPDRLLKAQYRRVMTRSWSRSHEGHQEDEDLTLVVTITRHYIGESIVYLGHAPHQKLPFLKIYRELYETFLFLAGIEIHYRDLNAGNVMQRSTAPDRLCLFDFDKARVGLNNRGDESRRRIPHGSALDDARSASDYFAPIAYQTCRLLEVTFAAAQRRLAKFSDTQLHSATEKKAEATRRDIARINEQLLWEQHRFIDDIESAIYLQLYLVRPCHSRLSSRSFR